MIKTLQKKFIYTAMAAVTVLLLLLAGGIILVNSCIHIRQSQRQLNMLADTELLKLKQAGPADLPERFLDVPKDRGFGKGSLFNPPIDKDTAMSLRFFTVYIGSSGQVIRKDTSRISSVSGDEAEEYARKALQKGRTGGYLDGFWYRMEFSGLYEEAGSFFVFLDASGQLRQILTVAAVSAGIAVLCWLFMLLLVVFLSRRAIRPIADNILRQKQFVTDAGHEIKTPLAIIQANIDAMELINGENKWSRNIRSQSLRLERLMQDLLMLARMDEAGQMLQMEAVSFSELAEESLHPFYELAAAKSVRLIPEIQPGIRIDANREYIRRLLSILLDNAVKYSPDGTAVLVTVSQKDRAALLRMENFCEKPPKADAGRLFDRFYRGDSSRTQKTGGYGIGLSAASAIVAAHKGEIYAEYVQPPASGDTASDRQKMRQKMIITVRLPAYAFGTVS